jgi:hypothetical protein
MSIMKQKPIFKRSVLILALLSMVLSLTSCALIVMNLMEGPEKLPVTKKDKNYRGGEYQNVLIIGLIEKNYQRVEVENAFVDRFTQKGFHPVIGSIKLPDLASLKDKDIINRIVREEQVEKVITIEVKDVDDKDMPGWLRIWMAVPLPKEDLTDMAPSGGMGKNVRFEIGLWDAKALNRQWVGSTSPVERFEMLQHVYEAADSTVLTLSKEKILRPRE